MVWDQEQQASNFPNGHGNELEDSHFQGSFSDGVYYIPGVRAWSAYGAGDHLSNPDCSEQSTISSQGVEFEVVNQNTGHSYPMLEGPFDGDPDCVGNTDHGAEQSGGSSQGVNFETLSRNIVYLPFTEQIAEGLAPAAYQIYQENLPSQLTISCELPGGAYQYLAQGQPYALSDNGYYQVVTQQHLPQNFLTAMPISSYFSAGGTDSPYLSSTNQPRYLRLGPDPEPWTSLTMSGSLSNVHNNIEPNFSGRTEMYSFSSTSTYNEHQFHFDQVSGEIPGYSHPSFRLNEEAERFRLDSPPPFNPVGPPPKDRSDGGGQMKGSDERAKSFGRRHGKLPPSNTKDAAETRKQVPCWHCRILREKCEFDSPDPVCKRCKPNRGASGRLTCVCVDLPNLTVIFCSSILFAPLTLEALERFTREMVLSYIGAKMEVQLTSGFGPAYLVDTYEVLPVHNDLSYSMQYRWNPEGREYEAMRVLSPCLAIPMEHIDVQAERQRLDAYFNSMLEGCFDEIPRRCFPGSHPRKTIQRRIMVLLYSYHLSMVKKGIPFLCLKLILIDFMMSHSITIVEETKYSIWQRLHRSSDMCGNHTCPRLLNKQIKVLLSTLYKDLLDNILHRVQKMLMASKKDTWTQSVAILMALAMVSESLQIMIRCREHSNNLVGSSLDSANATKAVQAIEDRFKFLTQLLHKKYKARGKGYYTPFSSKDALDDLDNCERQFVNGILDIIHEHKIHFQRLSSRPPPSSFTKDEPSGRILAQFILSFFQPDVHTG